jgi:hypothetical protein
VHGSDAFLRKQDSLRKHTKGLSMAHAGTPVISALGRLRQEDCKFKASLSHTVRPYLKRRKKEKHAKIWQFCENL